MKNHHDGAGRERTVRDLVAEFRGLSGNTKLKAVLEETNLFRVPLAELVKGNDVDMAVVTPLLRAMQKHSAPGESPLCWGSSARITSRHASTRRGCVMSSFDYKRVLLDVGDLPYVIEAAFGYSSDMAGRPVTGVNWSPSIGNPFRDLGPYGLDGLLQDQRCGDDEPIFLALHVACPSVSYTDRGKSALELPPPVSSKIVDTIQRVTKKWTKQRKAEERHANAAMNHERCSKGGRRSPLSTPPGK